MIVTLDNIQAIDPRIERILLHTSNTECPVCRRTFHQPVGTLSLYILIRGCDRGWLHLANCPHFTTKIEWRDLNFHLTGITHVGELEINDRQWEVLQRELEPR